MSIINEALKKTQSQLEQINPASPPVQPHKSERNIGVLILTTLLFVGFLMSTGVFLFLIFKNHSAKANFVKNKILPAANNQSQGTVTLFTQAPMAAIQSPAPKDSSQGPSHFVLNGIITMNKEKLALINNQILKEGDYIEDKRILSISMDKVEIFNKGEIIILKNKK